MPVQPTTHSKDIVSSKLRGLDPILQNQSFIQHVFFQTYLLRNTDVSFENYLYENLSGLVLQK